MHIIMVTGGLGSGKSTLCQMLGEKGAEVHDADSVARELMNTNRALLNDLATEFGEQILDENGKLIRSALAAAAFSSLKATRAMNDITFPYIHEALVAYALSAQNRDDAPAMVIEVPLLTELPELAHLADEVIAVEAGPMTRLARATSRGMDPNDAMTRIDIQPTDEERRRIATVICNNDGDSDALRAWVDQWWHY